MTLKDGDVVLWYYATFGAYRRPADARASAAAGELLRRADRQRRRQECPRGDSDAHGRREAVQDDRRGRACIGKHVGLVRATAPGAVRSNAVQVIRRAVSAFAVLCPPRRLRRRRRRGGGDGAALGHARPRRQAPRRHAGRGRADADARARLEADVKTRYGGRYVQAVNGIEGSLSAAARLVLVRQRLRGRPQRCLVPAPRRRCRLARLPRLAAGRRGARRRRCLPRAVRARLRREDAAGCRSLRTRL